MAGAAPGNRDVQPAGGFYMPAGGRPPLSGKAEPLRPTGPLNTDRELAQARKLVAPLLLKEQRVIPGLVAGGATSLVTALLAVLMFVTGYGFSVLVVGLLIGSCSGAAAAQAGRLIEARHRAVVALEAFLGCAVFFAGLLLAAAGSSEAETNYFVLLVLLFTGAVAACAAYALSLRRVSRGAIIKRYLELTGRL